MVEHHIVGDIDQRRNRPLPCGFEARLHPVGRYAVFCSANDTAEKGRAAIRVIRADLGRAGESAGPCGDFQWLQCAKAGRCKIARNTAHAHAILPVRRNSYFDHGIIEAGPIGIDLPHRRVGGKFDDAIMIVAQFEFSDRAHHAVRFDPADRRNLQHHAIGRHDSPRHAKDAHQPGTGIGRTANNLHRAGTGIDGQHLQLISLRVRSSAQNARDPKSRQALCGIFNAFNFQPDTVEAIGDGVNISIGIEMAFQPAERKFHAPTPPDNVGTSSALNP